MRKANLVRVVASLLLSLFGAVHPSSAQDDMRGNVDLTPIHGYWLNKRTPCSQASFDSYNIDASGASGYESSCKVLSSSRKGKVFTLKQRCEYFENEVKEETYRIRIVSRKEIEISGTRYRKCPSP